MGAAAVMYTPITLADQVNQYLKANNIKITQLAGEINYSRTTISRYLGGKYDHDATEIEAALTRYIGMDTVGSVTPFPVKPVKRTGFFESEDALNVLGVCRACQENAKMGIVIGRIGYGKTYSLKHYARMPRVAYIRCDTFMGARDLVNVIERALGIPRSYGGVNSRVEGIRDFFRANRGYLLIVDEAQRLMSNSSYRKIGLFQDIYDEAPVGIVLAGEPKLKPLLRCYQEQTAERIRYHAELQGLNKREVAEYMKGYDITPDALDGLWKRVEAGQGGCFRLLDGIVDNAFDLLEGSTITLDIITEACDIRWQ